MKTKKILFLSLLILTMLYSCRSRKRISETQKTTEKSILKIDSSSNVSRETFIQKEKKEDLKKESTEQRNEGEVLIKGNVEKDTPLIFHNIQQGDTLSSISIQGNAVYEIKNKWEKSSKKETEAKASSVLDKITETARKAVSQQTIKEAAQVLTSNRVEVKQKSFPFMVYVVFGFIILILIVLYCLYMKYGKSINLFINKIFKIKKDDQ